jgi:hypothetical protein
VVSCNRIDEIALRLGADECTFVERLLQASRTDCSD